MTDAVSPPSATLVRRQRPRCTDRGVITIQVLYIAVIGLLFAGALYGGGTVLAARSRGYGVAQSAARAGAQQIDLAHYRGTGQIRLDPALAAQAAHWYLAAVGAVGTVDHITAIDITVTASSHQATPALRYFGVSAVTVTSTASATATVTPAN